MGNIYAFAGKMGVGKTHLAFQYAMQAKRSGQPAYMCSLADPIKKLIRDSFGLEKCGKVKGPEFDAAWYDRFENLALTYGIDITKVPRYPINSVIDNVRQAHCVPSKSKEYKEHYRKIIQLVGTEIGRYENNNIWAEALRLTIEERSEDVYIDDLRRLNEHVVLSTLPNYSLNYVVANDVTRAKRLGINSTTLQNFNNHASEIDVVELEEFADIIITNH